jgi:hypothetical protein
MGQQVAAAVTVVLHAVTTDGCSGCTTFPPDTASACGTAAATIAYPPDGALWPPNLGALEVQVTPGGPGVSEFEVDFENAITDVRVTAPCHATTDQLNMPSGGCQIDLDSATWDYIAETNRGGDPVTVTVRETTDGSCATPSSSITMAFPGTDLNATIYHWEGAVTGGSQVHGSIARKDLSNRATGEDLIRDSTGVFKCYGCHTVSRDGARMLYGPDDVDNDDEYGDLRLSLFDVAGKTDVATNIQPGSAAFAADGSVFLVSDGRASLIPVSSFAEYDATTGLVTSLSPLPAGAGRPTQEDWSPDGSFVVYVDPAQAGFGAVKDDNHIFGGSITKAPVLANGTLGNPTTLVTSAGENNYYPTISPDGTAIAFDRVPLNGSLTSCGAGFCANDSFANPVARIFILPADGSTGPTDLTLANANPMALSNSYPRWVPGTFVYKGQTYAWLTFSSTRDYGLRVRNHIAGMGQYQCYPNETPQGGPGSTFATTCQAPQIWMAAVNLSAVTSGTDPSSPAIWYPYQDPTLHNNMASWATTYVP